MNTYTNLLDVLTKGRRLPKGAEWGIRSVHPDLRSSRDFRWPAKGWAVSPLPTDKLTRGGECPSLVGDGLCTARTWSGMASGGIPARTLLLTQHYTADVLGETLHKVRATRIKVVDIVDGLRLVLEHGRGADLYNANLFDVNLRGADLSRVNLRCAELRRATLSAIDLSRADLECAHLDGADLHSADLTEANLRYANLSRADLRLADLRGADLTDAILYGACLVDADLRGANLTRVNMKAADLAGAKMDGR